MMGGETVALGLYSSEILAYLLSSHSSSYNPLIALSPRCRPHSSPRGLSILLSIDSIIAPLPCPPCAGHMRYTNLSGHIGLGSLRMPQLCSSSARIVCYAGGSPRSSCAPLPATRTSLRHTGSVNGHNINHATPRPEVRARAVLCLRLEGVPCPAEGPAPSTGGFEKNGGEEFGSGPGPAIVVAFGVITILSIHYG